MTTLVRVIAGNGHDVTVTKHDKNGKATGEPTTLKKGTQQDFHVWDEDEIRVKEVAAKSAAPVPRA